MIDFRYHIVSIVAVFLALAVGLFLGSTTLQGAVFEDLSKRTKSVTSVNHRLEGEVGQLRGQLAQDDAFGAAVQPYLVANRLSGRSVVLISTPGVEDAIRRDLSATLTSSGASVTGDVRLKDAYVDPRQDALLGTLATRLARAGGPPPRGSGGQRAADQLASVLMTKSGNRTPGTDALSTTLAAYTEAQLLDVSGPTPRPGSLAVVLAPAPPAIPPSASPTETADPVLALTRVLDSQGTGAVLAAPAAAAAAPGILATARADPRLGGSVSTVDSVERPAGRIAVVFALVDQLAGRAGSFGVAPGTKAPLPSAAAAR